MVIQLVNEKEELQGDIYKLVVGHAFVWISDGFLIQFLPQFGITSSI